MRRFIGTAAALLLVASPALGQNAARQGFTVSFGLGAGSAAASYEGNTTERISGPSGYLRVGGAVSPTLVIAGESHGLTRKDGTLTSHFGYLLAIAQWYPQPSGGFYVSGGLGLGVIREDDSDPGFDYELQSVGAAAQVGLGYDVRMTRNFSLTPYVNFLGMGGGKPSLNGQGQSGTMSANAVQFGLGFTWH
jgi:hypothetical protein